MSEPSTYVGLFQWLFILKRGSRREMLQLSCHQNTSIVDLHSYNPGLCLPLIETQNLKLEVQNNRLPCTILDSWESNFRDVGGA